MLISLLHIILEHLARVSKAKTIHVHVKEPSSYQLYMHGVSDLTSDRWLETVDKFREDRSVIFQVILKL